MFKKTRIAVLVAGALCAAQAGAGVGQSDDVMWLDESALMSQQLTVFNRNGSSYSITPVEIQLAMDSHASGGIDASAAEQLTVFSPNGTTYTIVPADEIQLTMIEPTLLMATDESLPQQLTVFEPGGTSYSYEFTPFDVAMLEPMYVFAADDDISIAPVVINDEDAKLRPTYVAHFVSPPMYTGLLEETLS